jgi:hypothetical protein
MRISRIWLGETEAAEGVTITQAGFRWGNDDGSESAYTFINAQNVDLSQPANVAAILRLLINTTGDTPPGQFKIQVKRSTGPETEWRDVKVA